jgi:hypothetical protein
MPPSSITPWEQQGCAACRAAWNTADRVPLRLLGTNVEMHAHIHQCTLCGSFWEEAERYAHQVPEAEARRLLKGAVE